MAYSWLDSGTVDYTVLFFSSKENMIMARTAKTKPKTKPSLANLTPPPRKKRPESLTSREQEILELIWAGFKIGRAHV